MKSENEAIKKLFLPSLKSTFFVRTFVRVDKLHSKLRTEGLLSVEETNINHPFHPDIDILFWDRAYSGEPHIRASEVKYFRLKNGQVYPNIYEGLGETLMLLTYGVDSVFLWHLFDPEIPSETVNRYRDLTENLVSNTNSPINYQSWLLPESSKSSDKELNQRLIYASLEAFKVTMFLNPAILWLPKPNPIKTRWDTTVLRSIIKKGFRIINK